jgi:glycosyltransferase involved in cell wall biosynthesis
MNAPLPKITVIVPTFDRSQFLAECLESLFSQTLPPAQVIVINDGSSENITQVLAPFGNQIEYLETPNLGKSGALNAAMPRTRGDYVWIFDDDDVALPDALERFTRALEENPDCGFSYSSFYWSRASPEDGRLEAEKIWQIEEFNEDRFFIRLLKGNFLCGAGIFVRTSCYREVGPFREDLIRSQDYEMAVRLARRYRGTRIPGATFHYRQHGGLRGSSQDRFAERVRVEKWREYARIFFRELRSELELRDYLPRDAARTGLTPADTRLAYFERMAVMASEGLYDEMVEDLKLAIASLPEETALSKAELATLRRTRDFWRPGDEVFTQPKYLRAVRKLCIGPNGREVQGELGRLCYWRTLYDLSQREFRHALESAWATWRVLGLSGIFRLALRKLR